MKSSLPLVLRILEFPVFANAASYDGAAFYRHILAFLSKCSNAKVRSSPDRFCRQNNRRADCSAIHYCLGDYELGKHLQHQIIATLTGADSVGTMDVVMATQSPAN